MADEPEDITDDVRDRAEGAIGVDTDSEDGGPLMTLDGDEEDE